jgi:hypothetical protein
MPLHHFRSFAGCATNHGRLLEGRNPIVFSPEWMLVSCVSTALLARLDFVMIMKSYLEQQSRASTFQKLQDHVKSFRERLRALGEPSPSAIAAALQICTLAYATKDDLSMELAVMEALGSSAGCSTTGQVSEGTPDKLVNSMLGCASWHDGAWSLASNCAQSHVYLTWFLVQGGKHSTQRHAACWMSFWEWLGQTPQLV